MAYAPFQKRVTYAYSQGTIHNLEITKKGRRKKTKMIHFKATLNARQYILNVSIVHLHFIAMDSYILLL